MVTCRWISTGGLSGFSGPDISLSMRLCIMVIMNMKSRRLAWFVRLGSDVKIRLPSSDDGSWSRACWAGVCNPAEVTTAGMFCPAGSATLAASSARAESTGLAEPSSLAEPATSAGHVEPAESSDAGRGGDWMTVMVILNTWVDPRWSVVFLMVTGMMLSGQGPVVDCSPGWLWGQGPVVNRSPRMMMMRRPGIRNLRRGTCWSRMVRRITTIPGPGAGPKSRWRRWSGLLPTLMAPGWVTSSRLGPGRLMTSGWSPMMISMTTLITVQTMAIWAPSPGWAVGPGGSIHHRHTRWHSLAGLLVGSLGQGGWLFFPAE